MSLRERLKRADVPVSDQDRKRPGAPLAEEVSSDTDRVGLMLAYTPLHHLLLRAFGGPLVMTSANRSDVPLVYTDEDAIEQLHDIADALLVHDRPIARPIDDSVVHDSVLGSNSSASCVALSIDGTAPSSRSYPANGSWSSSPWTCPFPPLRPPTTRTSPVGRITA